MSGPLNGGRRVGGPPPVPTDALFHDLVKGRLGPRNATVARPAQPRRLPPPPPPEALVRRSSALVIENVSPRIEELPSTNLVPELEPGQIFNGYELVRRLGGGGCGDVWLVREVDSGRQAALKVDKRGDVSHLLREQDNLSGLAGKSGVVRLIKGAVEDGYLVMELVDGKSLESLLLQRGEALRSVDGFRRYTAIVVAAIAGVLHVLRGAHSGEAGVVHRDLSLDNIYLREGANGAGEVVILDWGTGYRKDEAPPNSVDGKLQYLSPEQYMRGAIDCRSDLYAVGCMLYTLLIDVPFPKVDELPIEKMASLGATMVGVQRVTGKAFSLKEYEIRQLLTTRLGDNTLANAVTDLLMKLTACKLDNRFPNAGEAAEVTLQIVPRFLQAIGS